MLIDVSYMWDTIVALLPTLWDAVRILAASILFGALLGVVLARAKLGRVKVSHKLADGYTTFIRCVPGIVLLYVVYYGLPRLLGLIGIDGSRIERRVYIIIAFALFCGASLSEVFRSAYLSVDFGQREAGISVGLTGWQTFRRILFPQIFRVVLPSFGNTVIAVLNEASLGFAIGYMDILGRAKLIGNKSYGAKNVEIYLAAAVLYWGTSVLIGRVIAGLEKKYGGR